MSSFVEILTKASKSDSLPRLKISLTDGNRVSLSNWDSGADCLIEYGPKGSLRQLIPFSQIAIVEFPDQE